MNQVIAYLQKIYNRYTWSAYLFLALSIFLLYFQTIFFDYSYLDDQSLIIENASILDRANLGEIFSNDVFFSQNKFYYRPLLTLSFVLDWHLGGANIHFFHFSNIVYHCLAVLLLFKVLQLSKISKNKAFFLSLFFAFHPVLTQAVAWVPGRNDSLVAIFIFSALIFFQRFLRTEKLIDLIFLSLFFLFALFTKESAILLPPLALWWAGIFYKEHLNLFKIYLGSAFVMTVGIIWYLARNLVLEAHSFNTIGASILDNLFAPLVFLGKIFWPFSLSVYSVPADANFIIGALVLLFILLIFWKINRSQRPIYFFALFWFWLFLLLSSLRPDGEQARNFMEHRLYLPMFALLLVMSTWRLPKKIEQWPYQRFLPALLLLFLAFLSFLHSANFRNSLSFWHQAIDSSPHSALSWRNLGAMYYLDGDLNKAEMYFRQSLQLNPEEVMANNNLAAVYLDRGDLWRAEMSLEKELKINPTYDVAWYNLGRLYYQRNDLTKAKSAWERALLFNPRNFSAAYELQKLYDSQEE